MAPDLRNPEERRKETRRISKIILKKRLEGALHEINYLILDTPTGAERNWLTEINISLMTAQDAAGKLPND